METDRYGREPGRIHLSRASSEGVGADTQTPGGSSLRTHDPFPVQGRLRVRYQPTVVDPVEIQLARIEAQRAAAQEAVARGHCPQADPVDLRGIPCIARGVGGTSPHTNPATAVLRLDHQSVRPHG